MCECFNEKIDEINAHLLSEDPERSQVRSAWIESSLNNEELQPGLTLQAEYLDEEFGLEYNALEKQRFFVPFSYCPFCGEKIGNAGKKEKSPIELFEDLEDILEEKLDNMTVSSLDAVLKVLNQEMERLNVNFKTTLFEEDLKIEVRFKEDADEDEIIEIYLEKDDFDDENSDQYIVTIF